MFQNLKTLLWENRLFFLVYAAIVFVFSLPFLLTPVFHTIDGATHVYNSKILSKLIFDSDVVYKQIFRLNPEFVPNIGGHYILLFLQKTGFNPSQSHKLFLLLYMLAISTSVVVLLLQFDSANLWGSFLILPFIFSFSFYNGFYNFSFGFAMLILGMAVVVRYYKKPSFTLLFLITVISIFCFAFHLLHCFFLFVFCGIYWLLTLVNHNFKETWKILMAKALALLPAAGLILNYYNNRPPVLEKTFINKIELLKWCFFIRPLIIYDWADYKYLLPFGVLLMILFVYAVFKTLVLFKSLRIEKVSIVLLAIVTLGLLFIFPDADGYGSIISVRICLYFFIFSLLSIAAILPYRLSGFAGIVLTFISFFIVFKNQKVQDECNNDIAQMLDAASYIPNGKIVAAINRDTHWLKGHYANYLSFKTDALLLDNYEAETGYFPVLWTTNFPNYILGGFDYVHFAAYWKSNTISSKKIEADYLLLIKDDGGQFRIDMDKISLIPTLNKVIESSKVILYKRV